MAPAQAEKPINSAVFRPIIPRYCSGRTSVRVSNSRSSDWPRNDFDGNLVEPSGHTDDRRAIPIRRFECEHERLTDREHGVADVDCLRNAPERPDRRTVAPDRTVILDVIVYQGEVVEHLDASCNRCSRVNGASNRLHNRARQSPAGFACLCRSAGRRVAGTTGQASRDGIESCSPEEEKKVRPGRRRTASVVQLTDRVAWNSGKSLSSACFLILGMSAIGDKA